MTDLFREVEEDLRREQFSKLWEKYGAWVIGLAVGIVVLTAAFVGPATFGIALTLGSPLACTRSHNNLETVASGVVHLAPRHPEPQHTSIR